MTQKTKNKYRTRNWKEYNQALVNRGSITFWFNEDSIKKWYSTEQSGTRGHPQTYSDHAIRCGLMIKAIFRTALRALQEAKSKHFWLIYNPKLSHLWLKSKAKNGYKNIFKQ